MSALVIEPMNDATQWVALEADEITPSTQLTIADDNLIFARGADAVSQRINASAGAAGHLLRRALAATDISGFSELRLSLRGDRLAGGPDLPFFLELRLASAALPIGSPGNTWHRLLPVSRSDTWETIKLSIDDLPAAIAGAVTLIQLRCISDDPPFTANVDDLTAVLPEMIADSSRAVMSRLSGIVVGGAAVPCSVRSPEEPAPTAPALDVLNVDVQFAPSRVRDARIARDYTDGGGLRLVPVGTPYDLTYSITPISNTGVENAGMIEAVLSRIAYFDVLDVDGESQTIETLWIDRLERPPLGDESPVLFYKVGARQTAGLSQSVRQVDEVRLVTDQG